MRVEIRPFVPSEAAPAEFEAFHRLTLTAIEADRPDAPRPTNVEVIAELRTPLTGPGQSPLRTARHDDRLVGMAAVSSSAKDIGTRHVARALTAADSRSSVSLA